MDEWGAVKAYQSLRSTRRTINLNCRRSKEFDADAPLHGRSVSPQVFTSTSSVYPQGLLLTDCLLTKRAHEDAVPGTGHRPPTCAHLKAVGTTVGEIEGTPNHPSMRASSFARRRSVHTAILKSSNKAVVESDAEAVFSFRRIISSPLSLLLARSSRMRSGCSVAVVRVAGEGSSSSVSLRTAGPP